MFRQPSVVDLVSSSSSDEDDVFPVRPQRTVQYDDDIKEPASPDHHFNQLDEPMEIEEDEPFEPVVDGQDTVASVVDVASALESVLKDLESDEDEEFAIQHDDNGSACSPRPSPSEAIDLSRDDSDNDGDLQSTPSYPADDAQYSHQRSTDDATAFFSSMDAVVMKSKYEGATATNNDSFVNREEGELSDDPSQLETDESWQQKQMEATYLREAQVALRQASLRNLAKTTPTTQPPALSKKKQRKLKRKLQEAAAMSPGGGIYMPAPTSSSLNMGYPHYPPQDRVGMTPPGRHVYRSLPPPESSILRVHRHVVMEEASLAPPSPLQVFPSASPNHAPHPHPVGPPPRLHGPNAMPPAPVFTPMHPPFHHHVARFHPRQEEHIHPPLPPPAAPTFRHAPPVITPPVDNEPTPRAPSSPDVDPTADDISLLESLRNAVKRSLKKPKVTSSPPLEKGQPMPSPPRDSVPASSETPPTQTSPRIQIAAAPTPVPSRSPSPPQTPSLSAKMVLGPNTASYSVHKFGTTLKPLTACTQTVKIQLSTEDCNMMRRRMLQVQSLEKVSDPIANLKQKIAAREVELLLRKKSTTSTPSSAAKTGDTARPPNSTPPSEAAQDIVLTADAPSTPAPASPPANDAPAPAAHTPSAASATMTIDPAAVAQSHITRLEKRIGELKHLISQKELLLVNRTD